MRMSVLRPAARLHERLTPTTSTHPHDRTSPTSTESSNFCYPLPLESSNFCYPAVTGTLHSFKFSQATPYPLHLSHSRVTQLATQFAMMTSASTGSPLDNGFSEVLAESARPNDAPRSGSCASVESESLHEALIGADFRNPTNIIKQPTLAMLGETPFKNDGDEVAHHRVVATEIVKDPFHYSSPEPVLQNAIVLLDP